MNVNHVAGKTCPSCLPGFPKTCKCGGSIHAEPERNRFGLPLKNVQRAACTLCDDPIPQAIE